MPAGDLVTFGARASAGMVLSPIVGIFCFQHQKRLESKWYFLWSTLCWKTVSLCHAEHILGNIKMHLHLYHFSTLSWDIFLKYFFTEYFRTGLIYAVWWPGDASHQGISNYSIDLILSLNILFQHQGGGHHNSKMSSYQYKNFHDNDQTVLWLSYLYNRNTTPGKMFFILKWAQMGLSYHLNQHDDWWLNEWMNLHDFDPLWFFVYIYCIDIDSDINIDLNIYSASAFYKSYTA